MPDTAPFRVLVSELCENVLAHSELTTPGYICARVLEHINKVEIAIADTGIGILESFRRGTNQAALQRIDAGQNAVSIAVEGLSSSKPETGRGVVRTYFGFGLFTTRRLVEENHGRLTLMSGTSVVNIERYSNTTRPLTRPWQGTVVGIVLDLNYPLPLEHVYQEGVALLVPATERGTPTPTTQAVAMEPQPEVYTLALSNYGTQLLTRDLGTSIRADVAGQLAAGRLVKVQLDGIDDITPSFVDEAFGKLSEVMGTEAFTARVSFEGQHRVTRTLIQFVLKTRQRSS